MLGVKSKLQYSHTNKGDSILHWYEVAASYEDPQNEQWQVIQEKSQIFVFKTKFI